MKYSLKLVIVLFLQITTLSLRVVYKLSLFRLIAQLKSRYCHRSTPREVYSNFNQVPMPPNSEALPSGLTYIHGVGDIFVPDKYETFGDAFLIYRDAGDKTVANRIALDGKEYDINNIVLPGNVDLRCCVTYKRFRLRYSRMNWILRLSPLVSMHL
jgi:hypothetical protein